VLAAALGAASTIEAERVPLLPAGIAATAVLLLALALVGGWAGLLPWPLVLLGAAYVASLELRPDGSTIDGAAPLVGAGLLALAELAYWSLELRGPGREERRLLARRGAALVGLALLSLLLGTLVVTLTAVPLGGGAAWDAVGVAAAAAALALILRLARCESTT
jgi:hypothetical protein